MKKKNEIIKFQFEEDKITEAVIRLLIREGVTEHLKEVQFCEKYLDLYSYNIDKHVYIAVESKINSVSRAFQQALRYKHLANYVYVALLRNNTNKRARDLSKLTGVGLILVRRDSKNRFFAEFNLPAVESIYHDIKIAEYTWNLNKPGYVYAQ